MTNSCLAGKQLSTDINAGLHSEGIIQINWRGGITFLERCVEIDILVILPQAS